MRPVPSLARRATVALAVLVAFYLTTIAIAPPYKQHDIAMAIAASTLGVLFEGALLEQGAEPLESLGDPSMIYGFRGEIVRPGAIVSGAMKDDAARRELARWAALLSTTLQSSAPVSASAFPALG